MTFTAAHRQDGAGLVRPRIGVSSCLLGEPARFNGGHSRSRFLTDELGPHVEYVPFCPELAIGLGSPREPLRLTTAGRLINRAGTTDHTPRLMACRCRAAWTATSSSPGRPRAGCTASPGMGAVMPCSPPTTGDAASSPGG